MYYVDAVKNNIVLSAFRVLCVFSSMVHQADKGKPGKWYKCSICYCADCSIRVSLALKGFSPARFTF